MGLFSRKRGSINLDTECRNFEPQMELNAEFRLNLVYESMRVSKPSKERLYSSTNMSTSLLVVHQRTMKKGTGKVFIVSTILKGFLLLSNMNHYIFPQQSPHFPASISWQSTLAALNRASSRRMDLYLSCGGAFSLACTAHRCLRVYERMPGIPEPIVTKGFYPKVGAWEGTEQLLVNLPHCTRYFCPTVCFVHRVDAKPPVIGDGSLVPSFLYTIAPSLLSRGSGPAPWKN